MHGLRTRPGGGKRKSEKVRGGVAGATKLCVPMSAGVISFFFDFPFFFSFSNIVSALLKQAAEKIDRTRAAVGG